MGKKSYTSMGFFLHLLFVLGYAHKEMHFSSTTDLSIETNVLRLQSFMKYGESKGNKDGTIQEKVIREHVRDDANDHHHHQSISSHMDLSVVVFFTLNDLKVGAKLPIYFPKKDPSKSPHLLPREEANSIPFSYDKLQYLLNFFSFPKGSPQAKAMENTLRQCQVVRPIKGETKFCATSLESMLDFVHNIFGLGSEFNVVSTTLITKSSTLLQNYTILEAPVEKPAPKMVACHTMPYPYAVFYCHSQESESRVFVVSLEGEGGDRVEALAVCHMDTSQWSRDHVSFRVLGIEPGTSGVCHFFPDDNLVYVPMPTTDVSED